MSRADFYAPDLSLVSALSLLDLSSVIAPLLVNFLLLTVVCMKKQNSPCYKKVSGQVSPVPKSPKADPPPLS